eukprot:3354229-Heterocapsa_arctica.AAC.1
MATTRRYEIMLCKGFTPISTKTPKLQCPRLRCPPLARNRKVLDVRDGRPTSPAKKKNNNNNNK